MLRNIEKKAEPLAAAKSPFSPTDKEVVQQLIARLRRETTQRGTSYRKESTTRCGLQMISKI
jgi:hypothetical protein